MAKFPIVIMTLAGIAFAYPAAAAPDGSEISREETLLTCATRDQMTMSMIEEKGELQTVEAEKLAEAMFSVMAARAACHEGRGAEAIEYYQAAHRDLMTTTGSR
jgi:uncharacterized protein YhfF